MRYVSVTEVSNCIINKVYNYRDGKQNIDFLIVENYYITYCVHRKVLEGSRQCLAALGFPFGI